jgi:serine/threonine-protein kinase
MPEPSLLERLKERNLAGAFFVYSGLDPARETWGIPETLIRGVHILLIAGFLITLVLAWYHGEKGRQRVSGPELLMVAALMVVAGVALTMLPQEAGGPESGAQESLATPLDDRPGIAVLPCVNHSPDPDDAYLAPSIHDEILLKLGRISAIRSMGRETVEWYRQHPLSPTELANELGVGFVGECSVQNDPNRDQVRLRFQLMDASGAQVWTQDYVTDLTTENLFDIQSDVAQKVAAALQAEIAPDEQTAISALPTADLNAYRLPSGGIPSTRMPMLGWGKPPSTWGYFPRIVKNRLRAFGVLSLPQRGRWS